MEPKPATMNEALDRLRDARRSGEQRWRDLADALEILVILGDGAGSRDLERDISDVR